MLRGFSAALLVAVLLMPSMLTGVAALEESSPLPSTGTSSSVVDVSGSVVPSELRPASPLLTYGAYHGDPLSAPSSSRIQAGDLVLVQFDHRDGTLQEAAMERSGFTTVQRHDASSLVARANRVAEPPVEGVRWLGGLDASWKVHPAVDQHGHGLSLVLADDAQAIDHADLAHALLSAGATQAWCGTGTCHATIGTMQHTLFQRLVSALASDQRVMWIEPGHAMEVHNAVAAGHAGIVAMRSSAGFTLDGSGETVAVFDTGLDLDHPDLGSPSRVASVRTGFGLDASPADNNEGHGTHVVLTVLGDGTGDSTATGMAPAASLVMYPLEHDPTGVFGRQGSLYEMLSDADQATARIAVNAWGLNGGHGDYTSDSRSVDQYVDTWNVLLPVFSVGDDATTGITPPATAKNALSVGALNGSTLAPWSGSGQGPTNDGRIKPDVIAPGIGVCSGQAEEARFPAGSGCGSGAHGNGDDLYMTLSGTSQATAVAGGAAALVREYIREQGGIASPSAALVKAMLINGAKDVGTPDIPNPAEGWGQIDLDRTILPTAGSTALTTFLDDGPRLRAGNALVYAFDLDPSSGLDVTLAWSDAPGSASSGTTSSRLINDLDLVLVAPDGTRWLGNDFASGVSTTGGAPDAVNNVERIRVPAGVLTGAGSWTVEVHHRGGASQEYALVVVADATATPTADLVGIGSSILLSTSQPLKNDVVSITVSWVNQGTADAPASTVKLTDTTAGEVLYEGQRDALPSGQIDSHILIHSFSTTGTHTLELALDVNDDVVELNDANTGVDNNVITLDVEVTALGLRVIPLTPTGDIPASSVELEEVAEHHLDVRNATSAVVPLRVQHEGTGNQSVRLDVTQVQQIDASQPGVLLSPEDQWSKGFDVSTPFLLAEQGESGDHLDLNLTLEDLSASIGGGDQDRYAASGTFVVDVKASYVNQPFVSHTQRITLVVGRVDDVLVGISGTLMPDGSPLAARPGQSTSFSIAVMNTGNSPATFNLACSVDLDGWQVGLDGTDASSMSFEPLDILDDLPMPVTVTIPPIVNGLPDPSVEAEVRCEVTSLSDPEFSHVEIVPVGVLSSPSYRVDLYEDGTPLGPSALAAPVAVDSGEVVELTAVVANTGNVPVDLTMRMQLGNPLWAWEATQDGVSLPEKASIPFTLSPGSSETVVYRLLVPEAAVEGDSNTYSLRTERSAQDFVANTTRLLVADELAFDLLVPANVNVSITGDFVFLDVGIVNTGNTILLLNWTTGLAPDGWTLGFSNPPEAVQPRDEKVGRLGLIPAAGTPAGEGALEVLVDVAARSGDRWLNQSLRFDVNILPSMHASLESGIVGALIDLPRGDDISLEMNVTNTGNLALDGGCAGEVVGADSAPLSGWTVVCVVDLGTSVEVGQSATLILTLSADETAPSSLSSLVVQMVDADGVVYGSTTVTIAAEPSDEAGGLFNILPWWGSLIVVGLLLALGVFGGRKLRASGASVDAGEDLLMPGAHAGADFDGQRRAEALQTGAENDLTSGAVSEDELQAALAQSIEPLGSPVAPPAGRPPRMAPPAGLPPLGLPPAPSKPVPNLPPPQAGPPLPPAGLPEGWTMEQWQHYGQQWLDRQG